MHSPPLRGRPGGDGRATPALLRFAATMTARLDPITTLICDRTGLRLSTTQIDSLEALVAERMGTADIAAFTRRLNDPLELQALVERLTIPETYFNRHHEQLDAVWRERVPALLARARAERRPLRLWSAGCCTGEEAYTLAIRAADAGIADEVEILATDINRGYLETARLAVYGARSVAKLSADVIARYFTQRGERFVLSPAIRERVTFRFLNLAAAEYPSPDNGTARLDVILCRNVLMYFDRAAMTSVIRRFHEALRPAGVLALGPVESSPDSALFTPAAFPGAILLDRAHAPSPVPAEAIRIPTREPAPERGAPARGTARALERRAQPRLADDASTLVARAESLADRGESAEAVEALRRAVALEPRMARAHFLLGVLSLDRPREADEHFRRVLYLDPAHWLARWHRARCFAQLGTTVEARAALAALERDAMALPPDTIVDDREGITCGLLALMCRQAREHM